MTPSNPSHGTLLLIDPAGSIPEAAAVISNQGYALDRIGAAAEEIDWAERRAPPLILISDHPPTADGPAICRRLKRNPALTEIPVLMLFDGPDRKRIDAAFACGASDYVVGPLPNPELTARISVLLKSSRSPGSSGEGNAPGSEGMFRKVFEEMPLGIAFGEFDTGRLLVVNQALCDMLGYTRAELQGMTVSDISHPEDMPANTLHYQRSMAEETGSYRIEKRYIRKDGRVIWANLTGTIIRGPEGEPLYRAGIVEDITRQKETEAALKQARDELEIRVEKRTAQHRRAVENLQREVEKHRITGIRLREQEEMARVLLNAPPDAIALFDAQGTYLDANRSLLRQLGLRKEELEGRTIFEERPETADVPWRADLIRRVVETGKPVEKQARLADRFFRVYAYPIPDRWGRIVRVAAFSKDITELRHLQERLIHTERMAATGQLAVSVAHEINSPLAALGFAFLSMEKQLACDEITARHMEVLKGSLAAIRRTVNNLLDLSRPTRAETQPTDLNDIIRRTVELNRSFLKKNRVAANLNLCDPPPVIQASPQELSQVFINLIKNAIESISVSPEASGAIRIQSRPCEHGVEIRIEDDGPGIPEADLRRIFDPFHTRRKPLGMGIGLSISRKIIESLSGTIQVSNRPEGGARFVIHLPLRPPAETPSNDTQGGFP